MSKWWVAGWIVLFVISADKAIALLVMFVGWKVIVAIVEDRREDLDISHGRKG